MKTIYWHVAVTVAAAVFVCAESRSADAQPSAEIEVAPEAGGLAALSFGGRVIPLSEGGGFRLFDATNGGQLALDRGSVRRAAGKTVFECKVNDVRLNAEFAAAGEIVVVRGEVENLRKDERGLIVDYCISPQFGAAHFSNDLNESIPMDGIEEHEGNVFPIAAICSDVAGLAMAIPPSEPRVFGMVASKKGLSIRFYLGTSPLPQRFPNRAAFTFIIYKIEPQGGFRGALSRYYRLYPDYYTPRLKSDGLWLFRMDGKTPVNIDQYGFDELILHSDPQELKAAIERDKKHGISMFPYVLVGQREMMFLPKLPGNYDEAMAAFAAWAGENMPDWVKQAWLNEAGTADSRELAGYMKKIIESSACKTRDGRYAVILRNTEWGGNSVSFKINPNPDLVAEDARLIVGKHALALTQQWLREQPAYSGIYVDSLGANWPAVLNYRRDHFAHARHPLTCDPWGTVALHNDISHYEFLETLRSNLRAEGRLLFGNGIYSYRSRGQAIKRVETQSFDKQLNEYVASAAPPEHYRPGTRLGRFFDAALLDLAGSEAGVNATLERCQGARIFMGKKHYAFLNYRWEEAERVEAMINLSLCFGIFATTSSSKYEDHPNGYLRDRKLLDWYVPLVRRLSRAGWEPVRYALVQGERFAVERFGGGNVVYYALYNDSTKAEACSLDLNWDSLGYARNDMPQINEIARNTPVTFKGNRITLEVPPKRTCVIQITKR